MMTDFFAMLIALGFVLGLIAALTWVVKRFGLVPGQSIAGSKSKEIEILEAKMLDPKNKVAVIRWHGKKYLVGAGQEGMTVIDSVDEASASGQEETKAHRAGESVDD